MSKFSMNLLEKTFFSTAIVFLALGVGFIRTIIPVSIFMFVVAGCCLIGGLSCHSKNRNSNIEHEEKYRVYNISLLIALQIGLLFRNLMYGLLGSDGDLHLAHLWGGSFLNAFQLVAGVILIFYSVKGDNKLFIFVALCAYLLPQVITAFLVFSIINIVKLLVFSYIIVVQLSTIVKYSDKFNSFLAKVKFIPLFLGISAILSLLSMRLNAFLSYDFYENIIVIVFYVLLAKTAFTNQANESLAITKSNVKDFFLKIILPCCIALIIAIIPSGGSGGDGIHTCETCGRKISNGGFGGMCEDCFNDFVDWYDKQNDD